MSHLSPCGCLSASAAEAATPTIPTDPAYNTLGSVNSGRVLVVPVGTTHQRFLQAKNGETLFSGIMVTTDGISSTFTNSPQLALPIVNPKSGGNYPVPSGVPFLMVTTAETNSPWKMLAAPTSGQYYLRASNGSFELTDAQQIPGLDTLFAENAYVNEGALLSLYKNGEDKVTLRKILAEEDRILVGRQAGDGSRYYKPIGNDDFLKHTHIQATKTFHTVCYEQLIPNTTIVEDNGIPYVIDAINDNYPVSYSPGGRRFFISKPRTMESATPAATDVGITHNNTWQTMGVHCTLPGKTLSTKNIFVSAMIRLFNGSGDYHGIDFGLFVDGNLVYTWPVKGAIDNSLTHLHKGLTLGVHDIDIRIRQASDATGSTTVKESNMDLFCL